MDINEIKNEMNEIVKKKKLIDRLLFPGYILWWFIIRFNFPYVKIIIMIILKMFNLDFLNIMLINKLHNFVYLCSPIMLYIGCKIEDNRISKEINRLNSEYQIILEKNKKINDESEQWVKDRDEVKKLYNIIERFEKLPRNKQMEVLNYIKGDLSLRDKYIYLGIDKLSDKYKEHLQTECEDIMFPDYENEINYTKKREK